MATSDIGQISLDLCSCGICDRPTISPKCLPCLHTFCKSCLNEHIRDELDANQNGKLCFQCPRCGINTQLPEGTNEPYADHFADDVFVTRLSEVISIYNVDKVCDICERGDIESPAVDWCSDCFDSLCAKCKTVHLHGRATSHHSVIPLEELRELPLDDITKRKRTLICSTHDKEIVQCYCEKCKFAICEKCLPAHKLCRSVTALDDAVTFHTEQLEDTLEKAKELEEDKSLANANAKQEFEDSLITSAEQIRTAAAALKSKIDQSERELLAQLNDIGNETRHKNFNQKSNVDHITLLKSRIDRFDAVVKYGNDKDIMEVFSSIKENINGMHSSNMDETSVKVNFIISPVAKAIEKEFKSIGEIEVEDCNIDTGLSSWGVTCTSREEIIVVDCRNKRVQKFTIDGNLIDHIQISEEPRDITCTGRNEVAITILKKFIFFIGTAANDMRLRRRIKTEKQYDSISMSNLLDKLLVSSIEDRSIDVIDIEGTLLQSFNADGSGMDIFQEPRYATLAKNGSMYVTDVAQGCVKGISKEGELIFEYKPEGAHLLRRPQDLCVDNLGNIFVVDYSNSRIHLITCDGHFQRFILGRDSGLVRPVAIHITPNNKLIIVQSDGVVKLFTYE